MTHETLDEAIDRVAGELTAVSANPAFGDQVRAGLVGRPRSLLIPVLSVASIAGAVLIALMLLPRTNEPALLPSRGVSADAMTTFAPVFAAVHSTVASMDSVVMPPVQERSPRPVQAELRAPVPPLMAEGRTSILAPGGPEPLVITELAVPAVTMPEVVEIAPLEIAQLEVPALETTVGAKEPR